MSESLAMSGAGQPSSASGILAAVGNLGKLVNGGDAPQFDEAVANFDQIQQEGAALAEAVVSDAEAIVGDAEALVSDAEVVVSDVETIIGDADTPAADGEAPPVSAEPAPAAGEIAADDHPPPQSVDEAPANAAETETVTLVAASPDSGRNSNRRRYDDRADMNDTNRSAKQELDAAANAASGGQVQNINELKSRQNDTSLSVDEVALILQWVAAVEARLAELQAEGAIDNTVIQLDSWDDFLTPIGLPEIVAAAALPPEADPGAVLGHLYENDVADHEDFQQIIEITAGLDHTVNSIDQIGLPTREPSRGRSRGIAGTETPKAESPKFNVSLGGGLAKV